MKNIVVITMLTGMVYLFAGCGEKEGEWQTFHYCDMNFGITDVATGKDYFVARSEVEGFDKKDRDLLTIFSEDSIDQTIYSNQNSYINIPAIAIKNEYSWGQEPDFGVNEPAKGRFFLHFNNPMDVDTIDIEFLLTPANKQGYDYFFTYLHVYYNGVLQVDMIPTSGRPFGVSFHKKIQLTDESK